MIKILEKDYVHFRLGHIFDYLLENGVLLHESEWNGEVYTVKENGSEIEYRPVYDDKENENGGYDIIGFEEQSY